jgi:predicted S18 family serine protease
MQIGSPRSPLPTLAPKEYKCRYCEQHVLPGLDVCYDHQNYKPGDRSETELVRQLKEQVRQLTTLNNSVIQRLVSAETRVAEAEVRLSAVENENEGLKRLIKDLDSEQIRQMQIINARRRSD